jgi:hypothetical protein
MHSNEVNNEVLLSGGKRKRKIFYTPISANVYTNPLMFDLG